MGLQRTSSGSAELWVLSASLPYHPTEFMPRQWQQYPMKRCIKHLVKTGIRVPNRPLPIFPANAPFKFISLKYHSFWWREKTSLASVHFFPSQSHHHLSLDYCKSLVTSTPPSTFYLLTSTFPTASGVIPKEDKPDVSRPCLLPSSCFSWRWESNVDLDLVLQAYVSRSEWSGPICLFHLFFSHLISTFWSHTPLCS